MSLLSRFQNDPLFSKVLRASGALFSANALALGLSVLQGALATRLLGPAGFGLLGVVMAFASTVNSLFSFRMGEVVVRYGGEYLTKDETEKAAALIKAASLAETSVSLLAFLVVVLASRFAESYLAKTGGTAWMFSLYALGLLANFNVETATGVLQITDKIKWQGGINLLQAFFSTLLVALAFWRNGGIVFVLLAYLTGKAILGLGMFFAAQPQLRKRLGAGWQKTPLSKLDSARDALRFALHSNISATLIKIFRESELIWVGLFLDTTAVGYYRVAYTLANFLAIPADPLIAAAFPEINRLTAQKAWARLKSFLKKITAFSFSYNALLGGGLTLFGAWAIQLYAGADYLAAYPALFALTIGLTFNYVLFWNRPLLLALGLSEFPVYLTLAAGILKLALSFWLVPRYGIAAAGALLSFYYVFSVGAMAWRGGKQVTENESRMARNTL